MNIHQENWKYAVLGSFAVVLTLTVLSQATDAGALKASEMLSAVPDAIGYWSVLAFVFARWGWKLSMFQGWLVPYPNLDGTWYGNLQTTWQNADGVVPGPIPVALVIRQGFYATECILHTDESNSISTAVSFLIKGGTVYFIYGYTNEPWTTLHDRSKMHKGHAELRVIREPSLSIAGDYFTDRPSKGSATFGFLCAKHVDKLPSPAEAAILQLKK